MPSPQDIAAQQSIRKRDRRRLAAGLNTGLAVLLAAVLAAMVNYIASRHHARFDWSRTKFYSLSEKTRGLLRGLTNEVEVVALFQAGHPLYEHVDNLLGEYEIASPKLRVRRVDPDRDLARTEEVAARFDVSQANVVVFACGERTKFVGAADLQEMDYEAMLGGGQPEARAFKGEQAFTAAIEDVTRGRRPIVYFLAGHGEGDVEDRDPSKGFSEIRRAVEHDNAEVRVLKLAEAQGVPEDASAVVVAGATRRIPMSEVDLLRKYLERNGRLMVLLSGLVDPGMEELLREWGIRAGDDVVVDPSRTLSGLELFLDTYGTHPATRGLEGLSTVFYLPRSVEPADEAENAAQADKPQVRALVMSSEGAWAETDREQKPMRFDASRDRRGPLAVAAASERGGVAELDIDIRPTRVVAFGDSDFVSNFSALSAANSDLFLGALNWLLEREELIAIAPKLIEESRLVMDELQLRLLFWCVVVALPGVVGIVGGAVWFRRRA